MPDDTETRRFPCLEKQVDLVPAVKADAQAPIFQNAVHLIERWLKPTTVIVVDDGVTLAGLVTGDLGRVGQTEGHRARMEDVHYVDAIRMEAHTVRGFGISIT